MRCLLRIADEQSARLAPDLAEALAALAHRRRIDDGQQLFDVVRDQRVEQGLVVVLQVAHQGIFAEGCGACYRALAFSAPADRPASRCAEAAARAAQNTSRSSSVNAVPLFSRGFNRSVYPLRCVRSTLGRDVLGAVTVVDTGLLLHGGQCPKLNTSPLRLRSPATPITHEGELDHACGQGSGVGDQGCAPQAPLAPLLFKRDQHHL